jgi:phytoene desaturase
VVVIGSGLGGLTAACLLAHRGIDVVLLEKNGFVGGYNSAYERDGFRMDVGATMIQTPAIMREIFAGFDFDLDAELDLIPLDPLYRVDYPDGTAIDFRPSVEATAESIGQVSRRDAAAFLRYVDDMHELETAFKHFFVDGNSSRRRYASADMIKLLRSFSPLRSVRTVTDRYFTSDYLKTALSFQVLYWGAPPTRCPAPYGMVPYFEVTQGVWHVRGGINRISQALGEAFATRGGELRLHAEVETILVGGGRATGVRLAGGETIRARAVVSNADATATYIRMVPADSLPSWFRHRVRRLSRSSATHVTLLAVPRNPVTAALPHHTFAMPRDLSAVCRNLFERNIPPPHFCAYVCRPTATDASMAPPGLDALYVLVLVPERLADQSWAQFRQGALDRTLSGLRSRNMIDEGSEPKALDVFLPPDFTARFNQPGGMGFGIQPTFSQMGPLRPSARSAFVKGLYLAGASTNPGGGVPLVVSSGRAAAHAVLADLR